MKGDYWIIGNRIGVEGIESLSKMLKTNTTLTSLNLDCKKGVKRKAKTKENDDYLADNDIGVNEKKLMRSSWGNRVGKLELSS